MVELPKIQEKEVEKIPHICKDCGVPIHSSRVYCDSCSEKVGKERQNELLRRIRSGAKVVNQFNRERTKKVKLDKIDLGENKMEDELEDENEEVEDLDEELSEGEDELDDESVVEDNTPKNTHTPKINSHLTKEDMIRELFKNKDSQEVTTKFWQEINRGLNAIIKEYRFLKSFCIARPDLEESKFLGYIVSLMRELENCITELFINVGTTSFKQQTFLRALQGFITVEEQIKEEIESLNKNRFEIDDVFVRMTNKFTRTLLTYLEFIMTKVKTVIQKYEITPPK